MARRQEEGIDETCMERIASLGDLQRESPREINISVSIFSLSPAGASMAKPNRKAEGQGACGFQLDIVVFWDREQGRPRVALGCKLKTPSADPGANIAMCLPFSEHELISRLWDGALRSQS